MKPLLFVRITAVLFAVSVPTLIANDALAATRAHNPSGAVMALEPDVQAQAKQIVISPRDLPEGWAVDGSWASRKTATTGPEWSCSGHTADLSSLVVHGAWSARDKLHNPSGRDSLITSSVFVLATSHQAQQLFDIGRTYYAKYCAVVGTLQNGWALLSLASLPLPRVAADQEVLLRTVAVYGSQSGWGDFILLRRGAALGMLGFSNPQKAFPADLETAIIRKFAARLRH
jgi:hypothetical protein